MAQRWEQWTEIAHEITTTGEAALYVADCAADVLVHAPSVNYHEHGADGQRRIVEDSAAAGVVLEITDVLAGADVTIWEGDYHNPPHDPHHCPATHTEVRIHPMGRTARLMLYFPKTPIAESPKPWEVQNSTRSRGDSRPIPTRRLAHS